jgi:hypothetical protein
VLPCLGLSHAQCLPCLQRKGLSLSACRGVLLPCLQRKGLSLSACRGKVSVLPCLGLTLSASYPALVSRLGLTLSACPALVSRSVSVPWSHAQCYPLGLTLSACRKKVSRSVPALPWSHAQCLQRKGPVSVLAEERSRLSATFPFHQIYNLMKGGRGKVPSQCLLPAEERSRTSFSAL